MKLRQVRRADLAFDAEYLVGEFKVRLIGPLYEDADGNPCTRNCPGTTVKHGWWVVAGPRGPMRVRTRDLTLPLEVASG